MQESSEIKSEDVDNTPFFSIVIPTKNRAPLLRKVIDSILSQDFNDYEIIVVNNDDTNQKGTEDIISKYTDNRIHCIRTGGLSMSENWNVGFAKARGKFLTLLRDKRQYCPKSLYNLHQILSNGEYDSLSWNECVCGDGTTESIFSEKISEEPVQKMINRLLSMEYTEYQYLRTALPKTSNSCISRKLYEKIMNNTGIFSMENAPDYTIGYQILFNTDYLHRTPMLISQEFNCNIEYSTGAQHDFGFIDKAATNMASKNESILSIEGQPLQITNTETIVIDDFLRVAKKNNLDYTFGSFNIRNYFKTIYHNTIDRQLSIKPNNQEYFKNMKREIRNAMRKTYNRRFELMSDIFVCYLLEIYIRMIKEVGIPIYHHLENHVPHISKYIRKIAQMIHVVPKDS